MSTDIATHALETAARMNASLICGPYRVRRAMKNAVESFVMPIATM
jgi:hypothetical protein